jgi:hypothetical protein
VLSGTRLNKCLKKPHSGQKKKCGLLVIGRGRAESGGGGGNGVRTTAVVVDSAS